MLNAPVTQALSQYLDLQTARMKLTAVNMANQNTAGYARRTVTWTGGDTVTLGNASQMQAPGAVTTAQRSSVLDAAVADSTASSASAATVKTALDTLQATFAITSSGDEGSGINAAMSGFFSAMQSLAADPSSSSARQAAFAAAQSVAGRFQTTSATLSQQSTDLDTSIRNAVGSVNQLTASIAALNGSIQTASSTADRDSLVDQRSAQIDSLSQLIGVQQTANGDGSVTLYTTSGGALVVGNVSHSLETQSVNGTLRIDAQGSDITSGLQGGTIGGALAARDGALATALSNIDTLATAFAGAVNAANANGRTAAGTSGGPIFSIDSTALHSAATVTVAAADGGDFAAAATDEGANGARNASAIAGLADEDLASGGSFAEALSAAISSIGTAAAAAHSDASIAATAATQAGTNQENLSGVSLDTEAANLTQYQRSYEAEAKLIAILDQIMTDTINLGTNTAVS